MFKLFKHLILSEQITKGKTKRKALESYTQLKCFIFLHLDYWL